MFQQTLSTQDNAKLLQQLKSGFKRTINWNKCQSKPESLKRNQYLNYLISPSFQGVNSLFVLSFENDEQRIINKIVTMLWLMEKKLNQNL